MTCNTRRTASVTKSSTRFMAYEDRNRAGFLWFPIFEPPYEAYRCTIVAAFKPFKCRFNSGSRKIRKTGDHRIVFRCCSSPVLPVARALFVGKSPQMNLCKCIMQVTCGQWYRLRSMDYYALKRQHLYTAAGYLYAFENKTNQQHAYIPTRDVVP